MQKITTFLTFNDQAEEAVKLYTSVFKNSQIVSTTRYGGRTRTEGNLDVRDLPARGTATRGVERWSVIHVRGGYFALRELRGASRDR